MIIIYKPKGGEPESFDARTLRVSEASIASRTIDRPWAAIQAGVNEGDDLECLRAVAWVVKKRTQPSLRWSEFDPGIEELWTRLDKDEVVAQIEQALAVSAINKNVTPEDIRNALKDLPYIAHDQEHAERMIEEMIRDPKGEPDPQPSSDDPTGTPTSESSEPSTSDSSATS
ncbi:hypothetical protein ACIOWI_29810 [Streptomyces sp. NPDC087659]|uniref:hypothetical protein n=1 Tax=Streptomyces sp. NPDC087659 TaxID=3365801 RepID=UPI0037F423CD